MWQFLLGLSAGVYIGTYYDCEPSIVLVQNFLIDKIPKYKDSKNNNNNN